MANDLTTLVEAQKANFSALLDGSTLSPERFINLFYSGMKGSYQLMLCAKEAPETLVRALMQAAAVGVEVNTPLQHACIIPRKNKADKWTANFQMMYRGLMFLGATHGSVSDWRAFAVYNSDEFRFRPSDPHSPIIHEPDLDRTKGPNDLRGAYSIVFLPSGLVRAVWMPKAEIESIRDRYSESWKAYARDHSKSDTPWVQRPAEMFIKTVVINQSKQLRLAGPPPVMIGNQVWERGAAAAAHHLENEDIEDAELSEDERPRARVSSGGGGRVDAAGESPAEAPRTPVVAEGKSSIAGSSPAPPTKLVLQPDNETPRGATRDTHEEEASVTGAMPSTTDEEDRLLTSDEASEIQAKAVSLGLSFKELRKVLAAFRIEGPEELTASQRTLFEGAVEAEAAKKRKAG